MPTFDQLERSTEGSRPFEIFKFALGAEEFRFTSAEDDVTVSGELYEAIPIARGAVAVSPDDRGRTLDVTIPFSNELASRYLQIPPGSRATVTIRRLQRGTDDPSESILAFKGFVKSVAFPDQSTAVLTCLSLEGAATRTIPRFTYSGLCNHVLYDAQCQVNPANFNLPTALVTAQDGSTITVAGASGFADGFFSGGFVRLTSATSEFRLVVKHVGNVLTLLFTFSSPVVNQTVDVFAGCNHLLNGDCNAKFNNADRFGGFPFVPNRNIFESGLGIGNEVP